MFMEVNWLNIMLVIVCMVKLVVSLMIYMICDIPVLIVRIM